MKILQHYFTSILLSICTLLCMLPAPANAQLLGGIIKSGKNVLPVIPIGIPATITLATNQKYFVASVYDTDYLPYAAPAGLATTAAQAANGVAEAATVNVQGTITTTGVPVSIAVTATGSGTLPAYTTTVTIPADMTQDGIARDLTLSWASQAYTSSTKSIVATLKSVGGTLNAKKLDINAGIGSDYLGVLLGQLAYPYNTAGTTTTYSVRDIPGIPDKMFGLADNGGVVRHNFLYLPVMGEDGKVWLNNNLGADYANMNNAIFNPTQQATAYNDYHAYGSLFQWGRKPDGHELINWTGTGAGVAINATTTTRSDTPANALFISGSSTWRVVEDITLWATETSNNNPCPAGFRVPSATEWNTLFTAATISGYISANAANLRLVTNGYRLVADGQVWSSGTTGYLWTSTPIGALARQQYFRINYAVQPDDNRAIGAAIRCVAS